MRADNVETAALLDCFGGMLTPKQREYAEMYYFDDLSLSEIAANIGISAPGVHDIITRATRRLKETERQTGIVSKLTFIRKGLEEALSTVNNLPGDENSRRLSKILEDLLDGI